MTRHISALAAALLLALSAVACAAPSASDDTAEAAETSGLGRAAFDTVQGSDGSFQFHVRAGNGSVLLASRAFADVDAVGSGIDMLVTIGNNPASYEVVSGPNGFTFDVKEPDTLTVLASSDPYASRASAERGATTMRALIRLEQQARMEAATPPAATTNSAGQ